MLKPILLLTYLLGIQAKHRAKVYGNIPKFAYYYLNILAGSPSPQIVSVILDTGSSVLAFPCNQCKKCGVHMDAYYDFNQSETALWKECDNSCICKDSKCSYYQRYTEGSSIAGYWFLDQVSIGDIGCQNPSFVAQMGCHTEETKLFSNQKAAGIMGVSPSKNGNKSVLDYAVESKVVEKDLFSLCLSKEGGMFSLGGNNEEYHVSSLSPTSPISPTSPTSPISPPLAALNIQWAVLFPGNFYYIGLSSVSVDTTDVNKATTLNFGSTILDSGTTYTYFSSPSFRYIFSTLNKSQLLQTVGVDFCLVDPDQNKIIQLINTYPSFTFHIQ